MNTLLNRLKEFNINAVVLNDVVFIVGHDGELLLASDVLTQLKVKWMIIKEMILYCRDLGTSKTLPEKFNMGLCGNFKSKFGTDFPRSLDFTLYPNFSGDRVFPLKSLKKSLYAHQYYCEYANLWKGNRGKERRKFCLWVANELEKKYNAQLSK